MVGARRGARGSAVLSRGAVEEPVAIVGMSCRYPGGVGSPEGLWDLLTRVVDAISGFPAIVGGIWRALFDPDLIVRGLVMRGMVGLYGVADFDAEFFGISPREAWRWIPSSVCCWKLRGRRLRTRVSTRCRSGSETGVFAGMGVMSMGRSAVAGDLRVIV